MRKTSFPPTWRTPAILWRPTDDPRTPRDLPLLVYTPGQDFAVIVLGEASPVRGQMWLPLPEPPVRFHEVPMVRAHDVPMKNLLAHCLLCQQPFSETCTREGCVRPTF